MKNCYFIFTLLFLFACKSPIKSKHANKARIIKDTLFLDESTLVNPDNNLSNVERYVYYKNKIIRDAPKGDTFYLVCKYFNKYKNIIKHSDVYIDPLDKGVYIERINDYKFKVFIDNIFSKETIELDFYLHPNDNYIINSKIEDMIIDSSGLAFLSRNLRPIIK